MWWYVAEYLDPADDSETAINPLVHYLVDGRFRGLLPLPAQARRARDHRAAARRAGPACSRRYDPDGLVDDYVVDYVRELARLADVFVLADCELQPGQLERLDGLVAGAWARRHGGARLRVVEPAGRASWSAGRRSTAYDEVLLANDSLLAAPAARRGVRADGRAAVRLLGAAGDRAAVRARARRSRSRCRWRR